MTSREVHPRTEASIVTYFPDPFVNIALRQSYSEGYPYDEFFVTGIKKADLQALADYLVTAPPEIYEPLETLSRKLEHFLMQDYLGSQS